MNSEQSTVNSELEFTIPMLTDLIGMGVLGFDIASDSIILVCHCFAQGTMTDESVGRDMTFELKSF